MAVAAIFGALLSNKIREANLTKRIGDLQSYKSLAAYSLGDVRDIKSQEEKEVRDFYKSLYNEDAEYNGKYKDYTEIPDFEEAMDMIAAKYQDQLDEIKAWEDSLNAEITVSSAELEELKAYDESYKGWVTSNIQNDYNFGQG